MKVVTMHNWDDSHVSGHTNSSFTLETPPPFLQEPRNRFLSLCSAHLAEHGMEEISELQFCSVLLKQKPGSQLETTKKNTPPRTQETKSGFNSSLRMAVDIFYAVSARQQHWTSQSFLRSSTIKRTLSLSTVTVTDYHLQLTPGSRTPSGLFSHKADQYMACPRCPHSSAFQ